MIISRLLQSKPLRWILSVVLITVVVSYVQIRLHKIPMVSTTPTQVVLAESEIISAAQESTPTVSTSCVEGDAFAQSIRFAIEGATLAQSARSKVDWDRVAQQWVQAVAWMQAVPVNSPQRAFAEKKVEEYMRNLAYSQQQAANTDRWRNVVSFNSDILDEQLKLYQSYVATLGRPDVLIIGSSRALQGIDPRELIYHLSGRGYPGMKVFNFSVNGATAQVVYYILRHLLTQPQLPRMLIWADGVRAFNSGRVDRTYDLISISEGNRLLFAGMRPQFTSGEPAKTPICYQFPQNCVGSFPTDGVKGFQEAIIASPVEFTQFSDQPNSWEYRPAINPSTTFVQAKMTGGAATIDANGFVAISDQFNPTTYYRYYPSVPGGYDNDYANFRLAGEQETALKSVVNFAKGWQIPLVFVNLPLTDTYLDSVRQSAETQFQTWMDRLSQEQKFIFRDLSQRWLNRYDYFADPSHLNRYGAQAVARLLANDSSLPWPTPR